MFFAEYHVILIFNSSLSLPLGTSAEGVMSLPPSVRLSVCPSVRPLLACLRDNSSHIQPLGTKFAPIMHLVNLQAAFENGVD